MKLAPVTLRAEQSDIIWRLGKMLLLRAERLEALDRITPTRLEFEFTLGRTTYSVCVRVAHRKSLD